MSAETDKGVGQPAERVCDVVCVGQLQRDFQHLKSHWIWLLVFGILLTICGVAAVIFPALTILTTFAATVVLGIALMVAGIATIIAAFWAGKWSGMLVQLLVGILYLVVGYMITEKPLQSAAALTLFVAAFCIVVGIFRVVATLVLRFPYWGWSLLNGMITFLLGVVIYRQFPASAIWLLGLLIGLEMLFHGWTWIMLSLAVRDLPKETA
jgi:uncharacterized membrane protein HdeD (DUF308 family)